MVAWNLGPTWAERTRRFARGSVRPIRAELLRPSPSGKALLIRSATHTAWVPAKLVTHDAERGVFMVPTWLAAEKLLD